MKFFLKYIALAVFVSGLNSCEEIIDLPLVDAEKRIVIEGVLNDRMGESHFNLSMTGTVYDNSGFEKISGAIVTVTDDIGVQFNFTEDPMNLGTYGLAGFQVVANGSYSIDININGESVKNKRICEKLIFSLM